MSSANIKQRQALSQMTVDETMRSHSPERRKEMQQRIDEQLMPLPSWEQQRLKDAGVKIGPNGHPLRKLDATGLTRLQNFRATLVANMPINTEAAHHIATKMGIAGYLETAKVIQELCTPIQDLRTKERVKINPDPVAKDSTGSVP